MLWCGYSSRHGIHDSYDFEQHGITCLVDWPSTASGDGHDHVKAVPLPVGYSIRIIKSDIIHPTNRYQGHVGAALVLGGVDSTGPHLFTVAPHGSTDKLPYVTMGSGSLAAMAVFESSWKPNMSVSHQRNTLLHKLTAGAYVLSI